MTPDLRFATFWFWVELFAVGLFSTFVVTFVFLRKCVATKQLIGKTVLITRGESELSQEIANQLATAHKCRVVLVDEGSMPQVDRAKMPNTYHCNVTDNRQVRTLTETIEKDIGRVDIVIDNSEACACHDIVAEASGSAMRFINLFVNFAPRMAECGHGQVVLLRSQRSSAQAMIDSRREIAELVDSVAASHRNSIALSTIFCNSGHKTSSIGALMPCLSTADLAARIIQGVRSKESVIEVSRRQNVLEYMLR